eukprot:GHVT01078318.1.p2 GENE.GHVT01078318.1~~GHVT01078318.1.p2  ORF type:complete len:154 (-),score=28.14 GHVT01078318.1:592-1053(-)
MGCEWKSLPSPLLCLQSRRRRLLKEIKNVLLRRGHGQAVCAFLWPGRRVRGGSSEKTSGWMPQEDEGRRTRGLTLFRWTAAWAGATFAFASELSKVGAPICGSPSQAHHDARAAVDLRGRHSTSSPFNLHTGDYCHLVLRRQQAGGGSSAIRG